MQFVHPRQVVLAQDNESEFTAQLMKTHIPVRWLLRVLIGLSPALLGAVGICNGATTPIVALSVSDAPRGQAGPAHGSSGGAEFSGDGTKLLFLSDAPDLVTTPPAGLFVDVYVQNRASRTVELVSVALDGITRGNHNSGPASISADGRWVVFESDASNLVPGDRNGVSDVFLRDLQQGQTRRISQRLGAPEPIGASYDPILSADGRTVLFLSRALNLVETGQDSGVAGAFRWNAGSDSIERFDVSVGGVFGNGSVIGLLASTNASTVVVQSSASNLGVTADGLPTDLFLQRAGTPGLIPISIPGTTNEFFTPILTRNQVLSPDGRYLSFRASSRSTNTGYSEVVWWCDLVDGRRQRVWGPVITFAAQPEDATGPVMSSDGQRIAMVGGSMASDGVGIQNELRIWSPSTGLQTLSEVVTTRPLPPTPQAALDPVLSPDGTRIAYVSDEAHPQAGVMQSGSMRLYLRTLETGATQVVGPATVNESENPALTFAPDSRGFVVQRISSRSEPGSLDQQFDLFSGDVSSADLGLLTRSAVVDLVMGDLGSSVATALGSLSQEGLRALFFSNSSNLIPGDTNNATDAFVRDINSGRTLPVGGLAPGKLPAGGISTAVLSRNGGSVAFISTSMNLQAGDTNPAAKVFVQSIDRGTIVLASTIDGKTVGGSGVAANPVINGDGDAVVFESTGRDLVGGSIPTVARFLYLRRISTGKTYLLNRDDAAHGILPGDVSPGSATMSSDGRQVLFLAGSGGVASRLAGYLWSADTQSLMRVGPPATNGGTVLAGISADGRAAFYLSRSGLVGPMSLSLVNLETGADTLVTSSKTGSLNFGEVVLSGDGSTLVFQSAFDPLGGSLPAGVMGIYAWIAPESRLVRVSTTTSGIQSALTSDSIAVSYDGRCIVFRGRGDDLVTGDSNQDSDIFLHELDFGTTRLVSRSPLTGNAGNSLSVRPSISADGSRVAFMSFASDLVAGDLNQQSDVFLATVPRWGRLKAERDVAGASIVLRWSMPTGRTAVLERADALGSSTVWTPVGSPTSEGGSETTEVIDGGVTTVRTLSMSVGRSLFRLRVL